MVIISLLALVSLAILIFSLANKYKWLSILNFVNLIFVGFYANLTGNILENSFNESFTGENLLIPDKFYRYLGLYQVSTFLLAIVIQIWFLNLIFLVFKKQIALKTRH